MIKVGVVGGSGYTGSELLRLLVNHPEVEVKVVTSRKYEGKKIWSLHKFLKGFFDLEFKSPDIRYFDDCDLVFLAVPHGEAMRYAPEFLDAGLKVIDLSADYRLDKKTFEEVYEKEHIGYREAVYGLPEIHRDEIKKADLVANPGCYPTGAILAVAPLAEKELIDRVVFDSKSGITGAGVSPTDFTHYPNLHEAIVPYKVTNHRHYWEMVQELGRFQGDIKISFTPQVFPGSRGILTNAHTFLRGELELEEVAEIYERFYDGCPFIRLQDSIRLSYVRGSNFCDIAFFVGTDRVVVSSAIDNLVKGASGQAIQNMNIMFGLDERAGLYFPPLFP
ncbi:N-acetyl-gamma-glutamyl-phosphate reductase [Archaeoglobus sulfaticallidus PM70-1]|uniref:N-acetyl-gamma-glutamyl-phosphate reductase n=1 Tax=Archaeoglobus sulfaticallidus PM70-1 TaxID=387631 RepID=N0BFZ8_9EURY|nr:N-acetyl-gamma-glutamyl-phosphate reductase [Archaeoglobus sulfaticallidus]AGK61948.1 N-acetyl-gamma-glutamyl-phosphate reductase [Archaeoglobus sulfaticallidus PM70-1]